MGIFGENDNGSQIIVTWIEQIPAYMATNITLQASYFVTFDNETKFSGYNYPDDTILIVGTIPQKDDNNNGSPARMILKEDTAKLKISRNYRDNVLSKTASGQMLIKLYYKFAPDICKMLKNNPGLLNPCRLLLNRILP